MQGKHQDRCRPHGATTILFAALVLAAGSAAAADFPVSGTIIVNGNAGALPDGGLFEGSGYDASTGDIDAGVFTFPQTTTSFVVQGIGTVIVTYQLSQTNSSSGLVASDGVAALNTATMKLQVISARVGVIPIGVGTCIFQPIEWSLSGVASSGGLDLDHTGFTIPPVGASDCGNYGSQINDGIAGSNNSIAMRVAGDFTPPTDGNDTIFENGFDAANRSE